jgi:hypothetical protein
MKRTLLLTTLLGSLLLSSKADAQVPLVGKILPKFTIGVKAGANFQTLSGGDWASTYKPGILGGLFLGVYKGHWGVQAEGLIKTVRFDYNGIAGNNYVNSVSLDVPLLAEYKIINRVWIQLGPQFSTMLSAKDNAKDDVKDVFKSNDISGVVGLEVKLPLHLTVGARYILGFTDINNHSSGTIQSTGSDAWRNRYAQLYLGFRFL